MKVIETHINFFQQFSRCVATIGKFDGVHIGHQAIIEQLRDQAGSLQLPTLVILIEPHPEEFFAATPDQCPARLSTLDEKLELLNQLQVDYVYLMRFDLALSKLSPEDYVQQILVDGLGIAAFIVGKDFRFGHLRKGDFQLLKNLGDSADFMVIETATRAVEGQRVSSTLVRQMLEAGRFEVVEKMLGRPYSIGGEVVIGRKLGTDLGFPTCNVNLHRQRIPLHGVYACEVLWNGQALPAAVNIGYRPTVSDRGEALLEAHLLDFSGDLYGQYLRVVFRHKIRDEARYENLDALKRQIAADVSQIREYFAA